MFEFLREGGWRTSFFGLLDFGVDEEDLSEEKFELGRGWVRWRI